MHQRRLSRFHQRGILRGGRSMRIQPRSVPARKRALRHLKRAQNHGLRLVRAGAVVAALSACTTDFNYHFEESTTNGATAGDSGMFDASVDASDASELPDALQTTDSNAVSDAGLIQDNDSAAAHCSDADTSSGTCTTSDGSQVCLSDCAQCYAQNPTTMVWMLEASFTTVLACQQGDRCAGMVTGVGGNCSKWSVGPDGPALPWL